MLLSLTIDRSACIGKPLIAEAVHCICKDKGFEGSLSIARKNCFLFLQYFFLYLSIREVITSLTRKSLASKGLLKIYAHIKMADPTLISFRTLFFLFVRNSHGWFYRKSDNDSNIFLIGFFRETWVSEAYRNYYLQKKSIDFKPLYLILRLTFGLLREATVML